MIKNLCIVIFIAGLCALNAFLSGFRVASLPYGSTSISLRKPFQLKLDPRVQELLNDESIILKALRKAQKDDDDHGDDSGNVDDDEHDDDDYDDYDDYDEDEYGDEYKEEDPEPYAHPLAAEWEPVDEYADFDPDQVYKEFNRKVLASGLKYLKGLEDFHEIKRIKKKRKRIKRVDDHIALKNRLEFNRKKYGYDAWAE